MNISEIYTQYMIMPSLQLHMLRVSGVAKIICENIKEQVDTKHILSACLLHDMGNILKFDLKLFPEFLEPEGLDYWQKVKDEYEEKYGSDEHKTTLKIARELKVSERTLALIDAIGFSSAQKNYESKDTDKIICQYSDMRVAPYGVQSLQARLDDGRKRFKMSNNNDDLDHFEAMRTALSKMETFIFSATSITPEDVTDERVQNELASLRQFEIE